MFLEDLSERWRKPWREPVFVLYFFVVMLIVGTLGVWLQLFESGANHATAQKLETPYELCTFFVALIAASLGDVVLAEEGRRAWRVFSLSLSLLGFCMAIACWRTSSAAVAWPLALLGT